MVYGIAICIFGKSNLDAQYPSKEPLLISLVFLEDHFALSARMRKAIELFSFLHPATFKSQPAQYLTQLLRALRRLQRLVAFDRRAGVEQHALAPESLVQPGVAHDFQRVGIQPHQPYDGSAFGRPLLALYQHL